MSVIQQGLNTFIVGDEDTDLIKKDFTVDHLLVCNYLYMNLSSLYIMFNVYINGII